MSAVECIEGSSETLEKGEDRTSLLEESFLLPPQERRKKRQGGALYKYPKK
jgi:hypothetical protein